MPVFHVIVKKTSGELIESIKEKESSAIKSCKMYVTVRGEPAAVVINNGRIVFGLPEGIKEDTEFIQAAMKKAKGGSIPAPGPATPSKKPLPSKLKALAAEYDEEMKAGNITIPATKPKTNACDIEVLESACIAFSLSRCTPLPQAQKICEANHDQIITLATKMAQHELNKYEAVQHLISTMQGNCPMTAIKSKETKATPQEIDVSKVTRGHKGAEFTSIKPTRIREDIGAPESDQEPEPLTIPEGIIIYTTKASDETLHGIIAAAMGYTPSSLFNHHYPAGIEGYDYRRALPLSRPDLKRPRWRAMGERIQSPGTLIRRIKEQFPTTENVRVEVANGVDLD